MKSQTLEAPANGATFPNQHHHRHTTITSTNNPLDTQPSIGNQIPIHIRDGIGMTTERRGREKRPNNVRRLRIPNRAAE
jgi:hypothetical protein